MPRIADIAGHGRHLGQLGELEPGGLERLGSARVDHERPAALGEGVRERKP